MSSIKKTLTEVLNNSSVWIMFGFNWEIFYSLWSDDEFNLGNEEATNSAQKILDKDTLRDIEDIGPTTQETPEPPVPADLERSEGSIVT